MSKMDQAKKPKKSLKRRIVTWLIGFVLFATFFMALGVLAVGLIPAEYWHDDPIYSDRTGLASVVDQLRNRASDPNQEQTITRTPTQETFRDLVFALHQSGILSDYNLERLAGRSGLALQLEEDEVLTTSKWDTHPEACIFTGPKSPADLLRLLDWDPYEEEYKVAVIFTYNKTYMAKAFEDVWFTSSVELPVFFAGQIRSEVLTLEEIEERCLRIDGKVVNLQDKPISELYGKYPFHYVSPR